MDYRIKIGLIVLVFVCLSVGFILVRSTDMVLGVTLMGTSIVLAFPAGILVARILIKAGKI